MEKGYLSTKCFFNYTVIITSDLFKEDSADGNNFIFGGLTFLNGFLDWIKKNKKQRDEPYIEIKITFFQLI